MKPQIALTPDQMHELQSLGLDCSDASMAWGWIQCEHEKRLTLIARDTELPNVISPAYTLEDIILKLDADITYNETIANETETFDGQTKEVTPWQCIYVRLVGWDNLDLRTAGGMAWGKSPMEAAFNALKEIIECFPDKIKKLER